MRPSRKIEMKKDFNYEPSPGIYWYTSAHREELGGLVAQCREYKGVKSIFIFGEGSSFPLYFFCPKHLISRVKPEYHRIKRPKKWTEFSSTKCYGNTTRCWIKSPEGYIGLGLLKRDAHGITGTIVWEDNPKSASVSGIWIRPNEGWEFSPIKIER